MDNIPSSDANLESLTREAILLATQNKWQEAVKTNEKILKIENGSIDALNRLAKAHTCLDQKEKAQRLYKKVLELDPHNIIAKKNFEKLTRANGSTHLASGGNADLSQIFIFEPGKTKLINLLNLAPPQILSCLSCGQPLALNPKKHAITISMDDGTYLGALPDDLAHRLLSLIAEGNKYEVYVKGVTPKNLTVIIKEVSRAPKFANQPSFQTALALEEKTVFL